MVSKQSVGWPMDMLSEAENNNMNYYQLSLYSYQIYLITLQIFRSLRNNSVNGIYIFLSRVQRALPHLFYHLFTHTAFA